MGEVEGDRGRAEEFLRSVQRSPADDIAGDDAKIGNGLKTFKALEACVLM